ncbi:MAG TPA: hypothetical protein VEQ60_18785, partial [Longimicrobium sp.]|nr:hypothetical protein [Longimicrobium sp.]
MMNVEKASGTLLPSDLFLTADDIALLERLQTFYETGRVEFEGKITLATTVDVERTLAEEDSAYFEGPKMCLPLAGVDLPMSDAMGLI